MTYSYCIRDRCYISIYCLAENPATQVFNQIFNTVNNIITCNCTQQVVLFTHPPPLQCTLDQILAVLFRSSGGLSHQGYWVGFRPNFQSLGLKSLINVRISPRSCFISLHPPQSIYLKWTMTCSCRVRDRTYLNNIIIYFNSKEEYFKYIF